MTSLISTPFPARALALTHLHGMPNAPHQSCGAFHLAIERGVPHVVVVVAACHMCVDDKTTPRHAIAYIVLFPLCLPASSQWTEPAGAHTRTTLAVCAMRSLWCTSR
jgi:hypothetical protein